MKFRPLNMFKMSYLCKEPARTPYMYISDDDHLKYEDNFWPDCKAIPAYGMMMSVCQHFEFKFGICFAIRPYRPQRFHVEQ